MKRRIALGIAVAVYIAVALAARILSDRQGCEDVACTETEELLIIVILPVLGVGSLLVAAVLAVSLLLDRYRSRRGDEPG